MSSELGNTLNWFANQEEEVREDYVRSAFPYPGSKAKCIENIIPHLPYTDMYSEPFGGSGAILLARNSSRLEIFNDRCSGVTAFFRVCRHKENLDALITRLSILIHSREEFIWCKNEWKNSEDDVERAARWYYMVVCSFGSHMRNFGRSKDPKALFAPKLHNSLDFFYPLHDRIKNCQIENLDWRQCFKDYDHSDMVWYIDPPYYQTSGGMYENELLDSEHVQMLDMIQDLQGFVAISGYPNELYNSYKWDKIVSWEQNSSSLGIAFTGTNNLDKFKNQLQRQKVTEVLWIKNF